MSPVIERVEPGRLFLPELATGADALSTEDRGRIQAYLAEVVIQRGMPLSTPSLWNALYLGWDLDERSYVLIPTAFEERLERVEMHSRHAALPVGALVRIAWGDQTFWAEVTYKDGARPQVDESWLSGALSGAPAHADVDGSAILSERLVVDPAIFGREMTPTHTQLQRLRQKGRWLDSLGHLKVEAVYPSADDADMTDAAFFARWLWKNHRPLLSEGRLGASLDDEASEEDLYDAFVSSLAAVEEIAAGAPGLSRWGSHFFARAGHEARLADRDDPLGGEGLERVLTGLLRPPSGESLAFGALGPRLAEIADLGQLNADGYSRAICHASLFIVDRLGQVAPDGLTREGVHLRLDDAWQQGGIWRAEAMGSRGALCDLAPTLALGLGWAASQGVSDLLADQAEPLGPEQPGEPEPELLLLEKQRAIFRVELAQGHISGGVMRLPAEISEALEATLAAQGHRSLQVVLEVPGLELEPELIRQAVALRGPENLLSGIEWPFAAYPGIYLVVSWTFGATVLEAHARLREAPLELAGGHYLWECNERALAHSLGLAELPRRAASLRDLILLVLRRRGHRGPDGSRRGAEGPIVLAIFGLSAPGAARVAVRLELELMEREGVLRREGPEFVLTPRATRPRQPPDLSSLRDYLAATRAHRATLTQRHTVTLFLRQLQSGHQASAEKERDFARDVAEAGLAYQYGDRLPAGFTYVISHERGYG